MLTFRAGWQHWGKSNSQTEIVLMMNDTRVFISYSHADERWLLALKTHLRPLERDGFIESWDDTRIKAGSNWQREIEDALATANVAILLVSAPFLASEFITTKELPDLLTAAKAKGTLILPIIISACGFERMKELQEFQAFNSPDKPLNTMTKGNQDKLLEKVAARVMEAVHGIKAKNLTLESINQAERGKKRTEAADSFPKNYAQDSLDSVSKLKQPETSINSANLPDNFIRLSRNKLPLRWKPYLIAGLLGVALGLIFAAMLARNGMWLGTRPPVGNIGHIQATKVTPNLPGENERDIVYVFGSGTVYTYLTASDPNIINNVREKEHIDVELMQGPTGTGANVFAHAFDQMHYPILVMASKKLSIQELSQSPEKPRFVFEVYLGADPLQMLLVTGDIHSKETSASDPANVLALRKAFPGLILNGSEGMLDFANLVKNEEWETLVKNEKNEADKGGAYGGSPKSGTVDAWKRHLGEAWPKTLHFWDIRAPQQIVQLKPWNRIYLGSQVLNDDPAETLKSYGIFHGRLTMVHDKSNNPVTRGLYLYGLVNVEEKDHGRNKGYDLPKSVVRFLRYVLNSLKDRKPELLKEECRQRQMKYFHLDPEQGWVDVVTNDGRIYRAEPCTDQAKE